MTIFSPWTVGSVESRTSIGRPFTLSRNAPSRPLPAQPCGEDVELPEFRIAPLQGFEDAGPRRHDRLHAAARRERQIPLDLRIERTAGRIGQRAVGPAPRGANG